MSMQAEVKLLCVPSFISIDGNKSRRSRQSCIALLKCPLSQSRDGRHDGRYKVPDSALKRLRSAVKENVGIDQKAVE